MALILPKSAFIHIPKTAGLWVRAAIKRSGIRTFEYGEQHTHFPQLLTFRDRKYWRKRLVFTFVRHPLAWYRSRWAFRLKTGWQMKHPLDFRCACNDFAGFVRNCRRHFPNGWMTEEYGNYVDSEPDLIRFVGRQERVVDDLLAVLEQAGESFNAKALKSTPRTNESLLDGHTPQQLAIYTPELVEMVLEMESAVISRYYADWTVSPNSPFHLEPPAHSYVST